MFKLQSKYKPAGGQPKAIKKLISGMANKGDQTLLGVTGSGKTFVIANIIQKTQKPTLVISHNKTLAAQLYQEFRDFFPDNAVEYFVSYYDYYQPESYMPATDTYIEKDASINEEIDKLRLSTTTSLLTREDVIVVASVSCIYNLGSPVEYKKQILQLKTGMKMPISNLQKRFIQLYYERNDFELKRGTFRMRGDTVDIHPAHQNFAIRLELLENKLTAIKYFDPISGEYMKDREGYTSNLTRAQEDFVKSNIATNTSTIIYPAKHYVAPEKTYDKALMEIGNDLEKRLTELNKAGKKIEAYRLSQRTNYDLEMIREIGYCKGIENYSRYFDNRKPGEAPYSLLDYFPDDYTLVIDESHITIPQIRGMYNGDRSRKQTLIEHGFRLPSALDNRPLKFDEFERRMGRTIHTSATPNEWELTRSKNIVELLVRPTGLVDPEITILPTKGQIKDLEKRIRNCVKKKERTLVITLTKRMSEDLSDYLSEHGFKVAYLHSDIKTLERTDVLDNLRKGKYDVLVGINLLREGLDLPEVSLVAILDADKEGFLRSETSLIQVMGRAARHVKGNIVMYADTTTESMQKAVNEVARRRNIQLEYNKKHNITPTSITKPIREKLTEMITEEPNTRYIEEFKLQDFEFKTYTKKEKKKIIKDLEQKMKSAAELLEFETAAEIRDKIKHFKRLQ